MTIPRIHGLPALILAAAAAALVGCQTMNNTSADAFAQQDIDAAVAVMHGTQGNAGVSGTVRFHALADDRGVRMVAEVSGLEPNGIHGIHVHAYGDCTAADATSAGGHYAPDGHRHALPRETDVRHAGDFGNLQADADGNARYELTVHNATIAGSMNPILGRAVIIHAGRDKGMAEQPTGAAGPRIACGVIGIANPQRR